MNLNATLISEIKKATSVLFHHAVDTVQLQPTNAEFEGSHTLVCFPLTKISKKGPEVTAKMIGDHLLANSEIVSKYNVVKGFLNLVISDKAWIAVFQSIANEDNYGVLPANGKEIIDRKSVV